jgi:hypothetical protein
MAGGRQLSLWRDLLAMAQGPIADSGLALPNFLNRCGLKAPDSGEAGQYIGSAPRDRAQRAMLPVMAPT